MATRTTLRRCSSEMNDMVCLRVFRFGLLISLAQKARRKVPSISSWGFALPVWQRLGLLRLPNLDAISKVRFWPLADVHKGRLMAKCGYRRKRLQPNHHKLPFMVSSYYVLRGHRSRPMTPFTRVAASVFSALLFSQHGCLTPIARNRPGLLVTFISVPVCGIT
jgi:hypothetical protein